jgi:hypothetical protein
MAKVLTLSVHCTCIWHSWVSIYRTKTWGPTTSYRLTSPLKITLLQFWMTKCPWYTSSNRIVPVLVVSSLWTSMYCIPIVIYLHPLCKALMMSYLHGMEQDI